MLFLVRFSISRLETCVFRLKTCISKLEICISNLEIEIVLCQRRIPLSSECDFQYFSSPCLELDGNGLCRSERNAFFCPVQQVGCRAGLERGHVQVVEGMFRNIDRNLCRHVCKVYGYQHHFLAVFSQEGVLFVLVHLPSAFVHVHQVEELSLCDGGFGATNVQQFLVEAVELFSLLLSRWLFHLPWLFHLLMLSTLQ